MNKDLKYLKYAEYEASSSTHPDHKVGCVIVYKNRIIGRGCNSTKTHPKSNSFYRHMHAEMAALHKSRDWSRKQYDISKCTIYVYREHKDGNWALSKPCQYCQELIKHAGIKTVVYTVNNGWVKRHDF